MAVNIGLVRPMDGTTVKVARRFNRIGIGCDLAYQDIAIRRTSNVRKGGFAMTETRMTVHCVKCKHTWQLPIMLPMLLSRAVEAMKGSGALRQDVRSVASTATMFSAGPQRTKREQRRRDKMSSNGTGSNGTGQHRHSERRNRRQAAGLTHRDMLEIRPLAQGREAHSPETVGAAVPHARLPAAALGGLGRPLAGPSPQAGRQRAPHRASLEDGPDWERGRAVRLRGHDARAQGYPPLVDAGGGRKDLRVVCRVDCPQHHSARRARRIERGLLGAFSESRNGPGSRALGARGRQIGRAT